MNGSKRAIAFFVVFWIVFPLLWLFVIGPHVLTWSAHWLSSR